MQILQITPGAGGMYCGNCLRDNSLVAAMRAMGHQVLMVPLYLPLTLDEPDQSADTPIFFGGISVYLDQVLPVFRKAPVWFHQALAWRPLLKWVGKRAAKTRAADLGEITLSMLRGEEGNQARELSDLIAWLKTQPRPEVICLSNVLLSGMARTLKQQLRAPVVCMLQGEDNFLDALPEAYREACGRILRERAAEMDGFMTPTQYFAQLMGKRLGLNPATQISIVHNGINLEGYPDPVSEGQASVVTGPPVIGYFARMCPEKGLGVLVEAYIVVRKRARVPGVKLRVGGSCGPADEVFVARLRERLAREALLHEVQFFPNLPRTEKIAFLQSLSVFSVPALYGEAFGLYVLEALAAGVPVVQPRTAAFPELVEATGGGVLFESGKPESLADALEDLLLAPGRARAFGRQGRQAVRAHFTVESMALKTIAVFENAIAASRPTVQARG